jgi:hypothetical protein
VGERRLQGERPWQDGYLHQGERRAWAGCHSRVARWADWPFEAPKMGDLSAAT